MTRRLLFFFSLSAFAAPQFISQIAQQQPQGFGTIRGTIVREGTTEPIPDVPVSVTGRGGMTAQEAQTLLTAVARGGALGANVSAEFLQNAQEAAARGGQALGGFRSRWTIHDHQCALGSANRARAIGRLLHADGQWDLCAFGNPAGQRDGGPDHEPQDFHGRRRHDHGPSSGSRRQTDI